MKHTNEQGTVIYVCSCCRYSWISLLLYRTHLAKQINDLQMELRDSFDGITPENPEVKP